MRLTAAPVHVLEADPELGAGLSEAQWQAASSAAVAATMRVERGTWTPPPQAEPCHMGYLVLDGLLTRGASIGGRSCVELLSAGDVLRPWVTLGDDAPAPVVVDWMAMEPATLAVLDAKFARAVTQWPEISSALTDRIVMRLRWLALDLAVSHMRRIDDRLMLLFWQLANRFGRVTPEGCVIPLPLSHQLLATLIGAQRPSVTTRIGDLRRRGVLERRPDGAWLLRTPIPSSPPSMDGDRPAVPALA